MSVSLGSFDPQHALALLQRAGFNASVTFHEWARFAMGRAGVDAALRLSPHYYNTEDEIDRFVVTLKDFAKEK